MNIYRVSQNFNSGWDTYDSAIVAANNENEARNFKFGSQGTWCDSEHVEVDLIGTTTYNTETHLI